MRPGQLWTAKSGQTTSPLSGAEGTGPKSFPGKPCGDGGWQRNTASCRARPAMVGICTTPVPAVSLSTSTSSLMLVPKAWAPACMTIALPNYGQSMMMSISSTASPRKTCRILSVSRKPAVFTRVLSESFSQLQVQKFDPVRFQLKARRTEELGIDIKTWAELQISFPDWKQKYYQLDIDVMTDIPRADPFQAPSWEEFNQRFGNDPDFRSQNCMDCSPRARMAGPDRVADY